MGIEDDIDDLFENMDCDGNGEIDLDEFILHSCDRKALITDFNLEVTFKEISKRGYIIASNFNMLKNCDEEKIENDIINFYNCKRVIILYKYNIRWIKNSSINWWWICYEICII